MYFIIISLIIIIIFTDIHLSNLDTNSFKISLKHIMGLKDTKSDFTVNIEVSKNIVIDNFENTETIDFKDIIKIQSFYLEVSDFDKNEEKNRLDYLELFYTKENLQKVLIFRSNEDDIKKLVSAIIEDAGKKDTDILYFLIPYEFSYLYYVHTNDDRYIYLPEYISYRRLCYSNNADENEPLPFVKKLEKSLGKEYMQKIDENIIHEKIILKKISDYVENFSSKSGKNEILEKIDIIEEMKRKNILSEDEFLLAKNELLSRLQYL